MKKDYKKISKIIGKIQDFTENIQYEIDELSDSIPGEDTVEKLEERIKELEEKKDKLPIEINTLEDEYKAKIIQRMMMNMTLFDLEQAEKNIKTDFKKSGRPYLEYNG